MGGFSAQVQSPQTTGGKGSPISDGQLPPAPANMDQPQGKGAGGGVSAMAPGTYDPSVAQRRFANTSAPSGASTDVNNPAAPNYDPTSGAPNFRSQGQMPITPTSIRQGKGAGNTGNNNSVMGQYFATQNQQSTAPTNTGLTDEQKMQDYAMVNNKNTITNSATSGVSPAVNKPDFSVNTFPGPSSQQPQGKGAASTNSATSGQPRMGQPNNYANTVGGWDNASIRPQGSAGKGKGG